MIILQVQISPMDKILLKITILQILIIMAQIIKHLINHQIITIVKVTLQILIKIRHSHLIKPTKLIMVLN